MTVKRPGPRQAGINALTVLAAPAPALTPDAMDPRAWNLTESVHALVDDTFWDMRDPADDVGSILSDMGEVEAIRAAVSALRAIADRQGPDATDLQWFTDSKWQSVQTSAASALKAMGQ